MKNISIIIVTWNSEDVIENCLKSISKFSKKSEVILVDSNSSDKTIQIVMGMNMSFVKVIKLNENVGFSKANNIGAKHATTNTLLLLNPDTILIMEGLEKIVTKLENDVGLIGCRLLNKDYSLQMSMFNFDTPKNIFLEQFMIGTLLPNKLKMKVVPYLSAHDEQWCPDWVIGAFMLIKKSVFFEVGGFSTEYFLYSEDMDLCKKVSLLGYKIMFVPSYQLIHLGGSSESKDKNISKQKKLLDSKYLYSQKFTLKYNMKTLFYSYKIKIFIFKVYGIFNNQKDKVKSYRQTTEYLKMLISKKK